MFTNKRPVPSPDALRFLRRIVFISSGTCCGVAALVAEEQRRRIHVARKVVDNARRLKQHPRHSHTAAAPSPVQESGQGHLLDDVSWLESTGHPPDGDFAASGGQGGFQGVGRHLKKDDPSRQMSPRSSSLPSEVDKGYKRLRTKERKMETARAHASQRWSEGSGRQETRKSLMRTWTSTPDATKPSFSGPKQLSRPMYMQSKSHIDGSPVNTTERLHSTSNAAEPLKPVVDIPRHPIETQEQLLELCDSASDVAKHDIDQATGNHKVRQKHTHHI